MIAAGVQDREGVAAEYLQSLHWLTAELEKAMQAIAENALSDLEESIANQQVLSARLSKLANQMCIPLEAKASVSSAGLDDRLKQQDGLKQQIYAANETLQKLNHRYAALLQHSSRSVALMTSLFNSFKGQFQEASGPRLKHQTWSCQM